MPKIFTFYNNLYFISICKGLNVLNFARFSVSLRSASKILSLALKNIQVNLIFLARLFVSL
jgi:hypothetical protein